MTGFVPPLDEIGDDPLTLDTPPPVAEIVIDPAPFVMLMPEPGLRVAFDNVLPVVLPIRSWPFV